MSESQSVPALPEPTVALYFSGMELHDNVLFVLERDGRKAALRYIKFKRRVAKLYADGRPGFSIRDQHDAAAFIEGARPAARMRLAILDALEAMIRDE